MIRFKLLPVVLLLACVSAYADFTPTHPFVYMDAADIAVMRDNVLVKKYPWAVNLYNKAKLSAKSGGWSFPRTYEIGKNMVGCALVYLIDGNTAYADGAVYWLNQYRLNYDPNDADLGKSYHFHPTQVLVPIVYDLMYNYLAANDPSNLAELTTYIGWFADQCRGSFGHNENCQEHYAEGICGLVLGDASHSSAIETDFKAWYNESGQVHDGFHYEPGAQAMKHYAYVIESQVHYLLAAHNAARKGYTSWDPVTWTSSEGWNVIDRNWRFMQKKATPKFQIPYENMWRGNLYLTPTCSGIYNIAYCMTGNTEWQAIAAENPGREILHHSTTNTYWAGLSHGREVVGAPRFKNDCVRNEEIGMNIIYNGDPAGYTDPNTSLHAYMMSRDYGSVVIMNLKLYGKGKKLNVCPLEGPTDSWGNRGNGGSVVNLFQSTDLSTPSIQHAWDVTDPTIKVMAFETIGHHRAVAVTDDYFVDVYDVSKDGTITWDFHGLGPASSAPSATGTVTGDFTCTWPDHMKAYVINNEASAVSISTQTNMPYSVTGVSDRIVNPIYTTESIRKLRVRRSNVVGSTRFISVIEPLGGGAVLSTVERFNTSNTAAVTGIKITAGSYTDYYFYSDNGGTHTLTKGSESISINGKWGFIRKNHSGSIVVRGSVTNHNIPGTPVAGTVATPSISPAGGSHSGSVDVTITCATAGAEIYYTTDGSDPTSSDTRYTGAFTLSSSATVKAIGIKSGDDDSNIASQSFTITTPTAATPVISPAGGSYAGSQSVSITCATSGADIYYTIDGSDPTESSTWYTGAFPLTTSATVKVKAFASGHNASGVASADFVNTDLTVAAPIIDPNGGLFADSQAVTITCATAGAAIHYTTDGSTPGASSAIYSTPLNLTASATVKALGILAGKEDSPVVSAVFTKGSSTLLQDDFEGGANLTWSPLTPAFWEVVADGGSDRLYLNNTDYSTDNVRPGELTLLEHGTFNEFTLEVDGYTKDAAGTADFGIIFGWEDEDNFYYLSVNKYTTANYVYKVSSGRRSTIHTFSEALASATPATYKVEVTAGQVIVSVDGTVKATLDEVVAEGQVGLCSLNDAAYFDNFSLAATGAGVPVRSLPVEREDDGLQVRFVTPGDGINGVLNLASAVMVRVELFDVHGRYRATVQDGVLGAGSHGIAYDAPAGIYLVRVSVDGVSSIHRIIAAE